MNEFINLSDEEGNVATDGMAAELFYRISLPKDEKNEERIKYLINLNNSQNEAYKFSYLLTDLNQTSLLHYAAKNNYVDVLNILIQEMKCEIEKKISNQLEKEIITDKKEDNDGIAMRIYKKKNQAILEKINSKNTYGCSPLFFACAYRNVEGVKLLISHGADIFIKGNESKQELLSLMLENIDNDNLNTIEIIKILLEHNAGIGFIDLSIIMREKNIQLELGKFGAVNVIGSGITRENSGFELAVCNVGEFIEEIKSGYEKKRDEYHEKFQIYSGLSKKRIESWALENNDEKNSLIAFFQKLDLLMPGSLFRLCVRAMSESLSGKKEIENKMIGLDKDCKEAIYSEMVPFENSAKSNDLIALLSQLQDFHDLLKINTQLDEVKEKYLFERKICIRLFEISFILLCGYGFIYGILDLPKNGNHRDSVSIPFLMFSGVFILMYLGLKFRHFLSCEFKDGLSPLLNAEAIQKFEFPVNELDVKTQAEIEKIQVKLEILRNNNIISDDLVNHFLSAMHLSYLIDATQNIIKKCEQVSFRLSQKGSIFYKTKNQSLFFVNEDNANNDNVIVELDNLAYDQNTHNENDDILNFSDSDSDSNKGLISRKGTNYESIYI